MSSITGSDNIPAFVGTAQIYLGPNNGSKPLTVEDLSSSFTKSPIKVNYFLLFKMVQIGLLELKEVIQCLQVIVFRCEFVREMCKYWQEIDHLGMFSNFSKITNFNLNKNPSEFRFSVDWNSCSRACLGTICSCLINSQCQSLHYHGANRFTS